MKRSVYLIGALFGLLTSLVVMAISYLGNVIFALPFLPFDLFEGLTRILPGAIVETGIQTMVKIITTLQLGQVDTTAKLAEEIQGLGLIVGTGIVFGIVLAWVSQYKTTWLKYTGLAGGFILWLGMAIIEAILPKSTSSVLIGLVWLFALILGWGWSLFRLLGSYLQETVSTVQVGSSDSGATSPKVTRRNILALLGSGVLSLVVLALGINNNRQQSATVNIPDTGDTNTTSVVPNINVQYGPEYTSGPAASPSLQVLKNRIDPAPGTRQEITPVDQFYRIDINLFPPNVDAATWRLNIKGMVNKPLSLTLSDIVARPAITQALTISCISNYVGGSLISSNYWTGTRLKDLLAEIGVQSGATGINMTAADGFFESLSLTEAMDDRTLLVYAMNGKALTPDHGYPLRIFIPDHYGMKQPKWLTDLEITSSPRLGYWEQRGWSHQAVPQTTSAIDTQTVDAGTLVQTGAFPLGGIAYAGARGIQKVEVQIDGGPWDQAELRDPAVSPLTWVQWRYDWKPTSGSHQIRVRATDGTGQLQIEVNEPPAPEGATGLDVANIQV